MKQLVNCTEEVVLNYVEKWFPSTDVCQCYECRLDIIAIMLNSLKPHYVVTEKGVLFSKLNEFDLQHKVDLVSTMSDAVSTVKHHPRHATQKDQEHQEYSEEG